MTTSSPPVEAAPESVDSSAGASWWKDLVLLALVAGVLIFTFMGMRPLSNPDEGRYTEIPREMAESGDFVTPRLNGVKYFEKPPLVYWLSALTFQQFGLNQFTARVWGGLFALAGLLLTYTTGRLLYGRWAGIWAAVVLATSLLYFVLGQIIILDMAVSVAMSGCLFAFILAVREPRGRKRFWWFMALYVCMALATLSKGLIGIAIPGAVMFLWLLLLNRWRLLWPFYPVLGTVVLLAIAAPWHVLAARANHDFLDFYFVHEHWLRFTTRVHGRYEPVWYFVPVLLGGLFPWVFFGWQALRDSLAGGWKARKEHSEAWFFVIWAAFIFLFFSKSQSKLAPYILPMFPAMAVLIGRFVWRVCADGSARRLRAGAWAVIVVFVLLALGGLLAPEPKRQPELVEALPMMKVLMATVLLAGAAAVFAGLRRDRARWVAGAIAGSTALMFLVGIWGGGHLDKASSKRYAEMLRPVLKAEDRLYCVGVYAQDLPVYLERLVSVADYRGELSFGIDAEPEKTAERFMDPEVFIAQWNEEGQCFALVRGTTYTEWVADSGIEHVVMAKAKRFVLLAKKPPQP